MIQKYHTELKWGVIFTLVALVWMVFERLMGWHGPKIEQHATMTNLFAIPAILTYLLALRDKRKRDYNSSMTWKQGFMAGLGITVVIVVLSPLAQIITHRIITPQYFPNVIEYAVSSGNLTQAEAEKYFSLQSYLVQAAVGALVMGIITSAVVAIFTKTKSRPAAPTPPSTT